MTRTARPVDRREPRDRGAALILTLFATTLADKIGSAGAAMGGAVGLELGPQTLRGLPEEVKAMIGEAVSSAIHPIFLIAAGLAVLGFLFALVLEEIKLANRMVPQGE